MHHEDLQERIIIERKQNYKKKFQDKKRNTLEEKNISRVKSERKNAANGQQLALSYVYDIRPKMVKRVKNCQKIFYN